MKYPKSTRTVKEPSIIANLLCWGSVRDLEIGGTLHALNQEYVDSTLNIQPVCENLKVLSILNCNLELNSKDYFKMFWTLKNWTYGNVTYVRLRALRQLLNEKQAKSCRERFIRKLKRMLREKRRRQEQDVQWKERKERIREQTRERVRRLRENLNLVYNFCSIFAMKSIKNNRYVRELWLCHTRKASWVVTN